MSENMNYQEKLTPYIGQRIRHQGPHSVDYGILLRLTERTADFRDEKDGPDTPVSHTEIYRITPASPDDTNAA